MAKKKIPAAACPRCGGWTSYGGMSQHAGSLVPVQGRTGCTCSLEREVEAAFEGAFKATRNWTDAYNTVLERLGGAYDPESSETQIAKRSIVGDILRRIQTKVMRRLKDPFTLAVDAAMKSLRRDDVVKKAQDAVDEAQGEEEEGSDEVGTDWMLYIMFDDDGRFEGWTIDYPDYWQGHGGPTAAVSLPTDWDSIESEIGETLAQAEIFEE